MVKYFMLSFICVAAESNIRHNNVIGDIERERIYS